MKRWWTTLLLAVFFFPWAFSQEDGTDAARRKFIDEFLTYYKEAYEKKNIEFIESFFSTNALIFTETKQLNKCGDEWVPKTKKKRPYKVMVEDKKTYIKRLKEIFDKNEKVRLSIPKESKYIQQHIKYGDLYGVSFLQMWVDSHNGSNIEDDMLGYVFLMIDFHQDEKSPVIHVRTWQPKSNIKSKTDKFNLMDFHIYDY